MLRSIFNLIKLPMTERICGQTLKNQLRSFNIVGSVNSRYIHITSGNCGADRRSLLVGLPKKEEGVEGESIINIDNITKKNDLFPDVNTPDRLFNGIPFKNIPVINIKCTPNNTLMTLTDYKGIVKFTQTCGSAGFKHARKGTNIAAQITAINLSEKAMENGYKTVRVRVRGLGPGRASSIKGLQMAGMNIISITDNTRVTWTPLRPRKPKRL